MVFCLCGLLWVLVLVNLACFNLGFGFVWGVCVWLRWLHCP